MAAETSSLPSEARTGHQAVARLAKWTRKKTPPSRRRFSHLLNAQLPILKHYAFYSTDFHTCNLSMILPQFQNVDITASF
jgi:hypothetical protein